MFHVPENCRAGTSPRLRLLQIFADNVGMRLTEEKVRAFIDMYEDQYGVRLSLEDAWQMAQDLVTLYDAVARPLPAIEFGEDV